jgi:rhamnosyltransferase
MKYNVNVLLATFNGKEFLSEQLDSLLNQVNCNINISIRDDHSTDGTIDIIKNYKLKFPNKINFLEDSYGPTKSACKNFLLLLCNTKIYIDQFDYYAFCDQDDIWLPNKVNNSIESLKKNNCEAYSSDLLVLKNKKIINTLKKKDNQTEFDYLFQSASAGCTYLFTQNAVLELLNQINTDFVSKLRNNYSHDWITYAILRSRNYKWFHDENSYILYRQHLNNVYGEKNLIQSFYKKTKLIFNGWYFEHVFFVYRLTIFNSINSNFDIFFNKIYSNNIFTRISSHKYLYKTRRESRQRILLFICIILGLSKIKTKNQKK